MTRRRTLRRALVFAPAVFISVTSHEVNGESAHSVDKCRVYVHVARKALSLSGQQDASGLERIVSAIGKIRDHEVTEDVLGRTLTDDQARIEAALSGADLSVNAQHPNGVPGDFMIATLRSVTSGDLLGEMSAPRNEKVDIASEVVKFYERVGAHVKSCPKLDIQTLLQALSDAGDCDAVSKLTQSGTWNTEHLTRCRNQLRRSNSTTTKLRVRTEGVPSKYSDFIAKAVQRSNLQAIVSQISRDESELVISCRDECTRSRIHLSLAFDRGFYVKAADGRQGTLQPFHSSATALRKVREFLPAVFAEGELRLAIVERAGTEHLVNIEFKGQEPALSGSDALQLFLK